MADGKSADGNRVGNDCADVTLRSADYMKSCWVLTDYVLSLYFA